MHKLPPSFEPPILPISLIHIPVAPGVLSIPIHDIKFHLSEII